MDGGMIGVVKEGTRDEERQMDHHDNTLECVCVYVCASISTCPPTPPPATCVLLMIVLSELIIVIMSTIHTGLY